MIRQGPDNYEPTPESPAKLSWLLAVDAATGRTLWRVTRPVLARGESQDAYTSPIVRRAGAVEEILTLGGNCLIAHDPATGGERWRWDGYTKLGKTVERVIPSPVPAGDLVIVAAPRYGPVYAFRPPAGAAAAPRDPVAWVSRRAGADTSTPLFYEGVVYVVHCLKRTLTALDARTGDRLWSESLGEGAPLRASPTGADGKIYCMDERGVVDVLKVGPRFERISRIEMSGVCCRSTIAAAHGCLFIRVDDQLYCIGRAGPPSAGR